MSVESLAEFEAKRRRQTDGDPDKPPRFSDEGLALDFAAKHADELRYVAKWGRWLSWDGSRWGVDETLHAFDRARAVARDAAKAASTLEKGAHIASRVASGKVVATIEKLAKSDRRLAATVDQWDADPWLLNTPDGAVDLSTGDLHPHRSHDYQTKITAVGPAEPGTPCPIWAAFLDRVLQSDTDLIDYVQRVAGYCLSGVTSEHQLWFLWGTGRNGKGVFLNTLTKILGDYSAVASMDTFIDTKVQQHSTDLAMLRGARLVTAQETEEGRRWAESKIKALTGGDPVTARFMRQDFFTFDPQFKLLIAGNHKPGLRSIDEAIRSRLSLVPFTVFIPPEERDPDLPEKLKGEWPAILRWAIEGCLDWRAKGLRAPTKVQAATAEYMSEQDAFSMWLDECCTLNRDAYETTAELYGSWKDWAERSGEPVGSQKSFSQTVKARGLQPKRDGKTGRSGFFGARLIHDDGSRDEKWRDWPTGG